MSNSVEKSSVSNKIEDGLTGAQRYYRRHREKVLAKAKETRAKNPEKYREACRAWYKVNKDYANSAKRVTRATNPTYNKRQLELQKQAYARDPEKFKEKSFLRKHGITIAQKAEILVEQGGTCAACKTTDPGGGRNAWHLDHNHATGTIRGVLCHGCNLALGMVKDNPTTLRALAGYVELQGPP